MSRFTITGQRNPDSGMNPSRKQYRKPVLEKLGDLRTMTLGGSAGVGDSGTDEPQFPPSVKTIPPFPLPDEFKPPEDPYYPPL